jgi:hypothetical protein
MTRRHRGTVRCTKNEYLTRATLSAPIELAERAGVQVRQPRWRARGSPRRGQPAVTWAVIRLVRNLISGLSALSLGRPGRAYTGEGEITTGYDPADRSKLVLDIPAMQKRALHDYIKREQEPKAQPAARPGARTRQPWTVPAHCPNCGAPIDQAKASRDPDPQCQFCHQPVPVEPVR